MYNLRFSLISPVCHAKEALTPIMTNYDPPTAQHNDQSQIYHSRNIIESHDQAARNKHIHVSFQQTYNN